MRAIEQSVVATAAQRGLIKLATAKVARAAGCSESTVRSWWLGKRVSADTHAAIMRALGVIESREAA